MTLLSALLNIVNKVQSAERKNTSSHMVIHIKTCYKKYISLIRNLKNVTGATELDSFVRDGFFM